MRLFLPAAFLLISLHASADTRAVPAATREGLVGVWEAAAQEGSMATEVYQMIIPKEGDAHFIHIVTAGKDRSFSKFFGRATAIELANGNVQIRFIMAPEHINYFDWVEIQGYAVADKEIGAITGKIVKHRTQPRDEWSHPVKFKKGRWLRDLARISDEADRIIRDPAFKNGHAIPKENAKSP